MFTYPLMSPKFLQLPTSNTIMDIAVLWVKATGVFQQILQRQFHFGRDESLADFSSPHVKAIFSEINEASLICSMLLMQHTHNLLNHAFNQTHNSTIIREYSVRAWVIQDEHCSEQVNAGYMVTGLIGNETFR